VLCQDDEIQLPEEGGLYQIPKWCLGIVRGCMVDVHHPYQSRDHDEPHCLAPSRPKCSKQTCERTWGIPGRDAVSEHPRYRSNVSDLVIREMREDEQQGVLDLLEHAFGVREVFVRYMSCDPLLCSADTLLAVVDDTPVSCLQIFSKEIRLRGNTVKIGGIGSVATAASYRRQGLAGRLLARAITEMQRRGMVLSLLFTGLQGFYERQGYVPVTRRYLVLHPPSQRLDLPEAAGSRDFAPGDLATVQRLYDSYCDAFECSTVRDSSYWEGQLVYAGNPDEIFQVTEREGRITAYARMIEMNGAQIVTEFARRPDAPGELAVLLANLAPTGRPMICPRAPDPQLQQRLQGLGLWLDDWRTSDSLWRVIDRDAAVRLAGLQDTSEAPALIRALVGSGQSVYWPSDRF
jgi:predicted N-acetyltransferase YhbS